MIDGSTINANPAGGVAFDVCRYSSYPSVHVTVKGNSVINGNVEVDAGNVVTLENVEGSGYSFNAGTTAYALDNGGDGPVFAPISASSSSVTLVAVNDASYPNAYMLLMLSGTD